MLPLRAAPAALLAKPEQSGSDKNDGQKVHHIPKSICWLLALLYRLRRGWLRCRRCGRRSGSWCIIGCRSLYSGVLVMAGRTQISVWIFCVCYRQMKACAVIGIQLLLLALELVALRCIACNTGR